MGSLTYEHGVIEEAVWKGLLARNREGWVTAVNEARKLVQPWHVYSAVNTHATAGRLKACCCSDLLWLC
jgi:hypothetical protein